MKFREIVDRRDEHPYHGHAESMRLPAYCEDCSLCREEKARLLKELLETEDDGA